ncbi:MAG: PP2C family protein-serine/threonine phosphatase [Planctomycetota bacterium]
MRTTPTGTPPSVIPLEGIANVAEAIEMQRAMSRATDAADFIEAFITRFRKFAGAVHLMNLQLGGLPEGDFRVVFSTALHDDPSPSRRDTSEPASEAPSEPMPRLAIDWDRPIGDVPVQRSAVLSRLVSGESPKFAQSVKRSDDPVLALHLETEPVDIVALPIFRDGTVDEYAVVCREAGGPPPGVEIPVVVNNVNLLNRGIVTIKARSDLQQLHERLNAQLSEIGRLQRSLLPTSPPPDQRFDVASIYLPCEQAGGDYFDYVPFPDGTTRFLIADVAGHGAVAAVAMTMLRTAMHAFRHTQSPHDEVVEPINLLMRESLDVGVFITAFFCSIDPATGVVSYACCGHNPPRIVRGGTVIEPFEFEAVPPLGIVDPLGIAPAEFCLKPGDLLVLYTDGFPEAFSPNREQFGLERLDNAILKGGGCPRLSLEYLLADVEQHAAGHPRDDDQTLLAIRYLGPQEPPARPDPSPIQARSSPTRPDQI